MTISELRQAVRTLMVRQNRGYTAASVLMLGLGIGAVATIFAILHAVMLAPLPYREPDRVFGLNQTKPAESLVFVTSAADFLSWSERVKGYGGLTAYFGSNANLEAGGEVERVESVEATPNFWDVLGIPMVAGRAFDASEDHLEARAAVIGESLWRRRFGADPKVLGSTLVIDGIPRVIVGIAPMDVGFTRKAEVWLPLAAKEQPWGRGDRRLNVLARLAPGATREAADAELVSIQADLAREFPDDDRGWSAASVPVREYIVGSTLRERVLVLSGAVLLLILVVCLNVANLQLARASAREREIGVRQALGATRARLVRQIAAECLVLSLLGGALGIGLASAAIGVAGRELAARSPQLEALTLDWRVAAVVLAFAALTALVAGLAPAMLAARASATAALAGASRSPGEAGRSPVRQALVVAQFALATLLVVASALLVQQFQAIQSKSLGFAPERVLSARLTLPDDDNGTHYRENAAAYQRLLDGVRALPGVERAGIGTEVPLGQFNTTSMAAAPGKGTVSQARNGGLLVAWRVVSSDFLETLGVPLVRGRTFAPSGESSRSMLVSEGTARRLWPDGSDPIGQNITLSNSQTYTVVGVVGDVRQLERGADPTPSVYMSTNWAMLSTMTLALKTRVAPEQAIAQVRDAAARAIPDRPLFEIRPMSAVIAENVAEPRAQTAVLSLFGAVSLLLAALGVAGVTAFTVVRRTPELAVRMALGATPKRIIGHVMARGWVLCGAGVAAGTLLTLLLVEGAGKLLPIPDVRVVPTLGAVVLALAVVGLLACWIPARRASRISPSLTLRGE